MREIEGKYKIDEFYHVRERLFRNSGEYIGKYLETNTLLDFGNFFEKRGAVFRIRHFDDKTVLTIKGKVIKEEFDVKNRFEFNMSIPYFIARTARYLMRETVRYEKIREDYSLEGCVVSLDYIDGLGHFVEIEGKSASKVNSLKEKLGIIGENLPESYPSMVKKMSK